MPVRPAPPIARIVAGNVLGAMLTGFYFNHIDPRAAALGSPPGGRDLPLFVVGIALIATLGYRLARRWWRPLADPGDPPSALARRRALLLPYALAGITLAGWALAGALWGIVWPLLVGSFSAAGAARIVFGVTGIGGTVTTAFVFLLSEHRWRASLPAFFPDGDVSAVGGAPRLGVRVRLLAVFLLISVVPLALVGVLASTSATALLGADRGAAEVIAGRMVPVILFVVAVGIAAAIGLASLVARSVATPLRELVRAMAEVQHGDLDQRCAVVTTDELGTVATGFNRMVHGLREREWIREAFGRYVTQEIRDEILAGRIALEGQAVEVTILFADLRDFTSWVEATDPREVLHDLNEYFTEMERAITSHGGLVLQYIGDEIEAVFGAPMALSDHAGRAVRAALDMRRRLAAWNAAREPAGRRPFRHGIGIHTATVLAGNVGSANRLSYALVGDGVNLASRIQDLTKEVGADVVVSGTTRARLDPDVALAPLPAVHVKGRLAEVEVYRLL